jgi:hypothetical protein
MITFSGKLPDGTYTEDIGYYVERWQVIRVAVLKLGYEVVAIDPSIIIQKGGIGKIYHIPADIVLKILQLEEELEHLYQNK